MKNVVLSIVAVAGAATAASAQWGGPIETELCFQVWDGAQWAQTTTVAPGSRVEWRAVVSYTGTRTDLFGWGSMQYQPYLTNADNSGVQDTHLAFRNGGTQGSAIPGAMLTQAEGNNGGPLASYGRVTFGGTAANAAGLNIVSQFRHGGGSPQAGAPAGSYIRLAGSSVTNWPVYPLNTAALATAANINAIKRGIKADQTAQTNPITGIVNTFYLTGTQNLVVFRGAFQLGDSLDTRTITADISSQDRASSGTNDNRFATWHTNAFGSGYNTGVSFKAATILIPSPASLALLGLGGLVAARRRRA